MVAPLRIARFGHSAVTYNDTLYVIGGRNESFTCLDSVETFDPVTKTWIEADPLPEKRCWTGAAVVLS